MSATDRKDVYIRLVTALMDEVASCRPGVPRPELARAIAKRRNFESRLQAGRVSLRHMEDMAGAICHWLGQED